MPLSINGSLVLPNKIIKGTITVENGKITDIYSSSESGEDGESRSSNDNSSRSAQTIEYDKKGLYILPGLIEIHGHMREPGLTQKEDIPHGTKAALAGGFTTIIDMPNTNPPTTTIERLHEKMEKIYPNRSYADYAFFMGASSNSIDELEKVDHKEIVGIKVFMAGHEPTPTTIPDDETLEKIMAIAAKKNLLVAVHAEDQELINKYNSLFKKTGRTDAALWSEIRPKDVVIKAVQRVLTLAKKYNTKVYLLHLSTKEEFALVKAAKDTGVEAFGELVGYQLFFTIDDYKTYGNKIKVAPALRTKEEQNKVWGLLRKGKVDVFCCEHTPHEWELKNQPDMWKAPAGMPGLQETLPMLITKWTERFGNENVEECLMTVAKVASKNPAQILGLKTKGEIAVDKDADLTIIDVKTPWTVKKEDLFSKCGWSAYEGKTLIGRPIATYLRGNLVYENGSIISKPLGQQIIAF